jgi:hypothetical protein
MKILLKIQDVAVKQLESAIWMYAYDYDEVAVHTISAAAFELLTERLKLINFKEDMEKVIKPEKQKEFFGLWNKPYTFFKHGEFNYKEIEEMEYNDETVDILLFIASEANLQGPEEYRLKCALVYRSYFIINNPQMIDPIVYDAIYKKPIEKLGFTAEQMKSKDTLRTMLKLIGHTFVNGTDSPYTKMYGES